MTSQLGRQIGGVGKYSVYHRGPNDYIVVNKNTGTIVSKKRQQSPAWRDAEWLHKNQ